MRSSRGPTLRSLVLLSCILGALVCSSSATTYKLPWNIPTAASFYDDWAGANTFEVGDAIEFDYQLGAHNVYAVSPKDGAGCVTSNPIQEWNGASPVVTLDRPGTLSFVCGFPSHCQLGMKFTVQVVGSAAPPPAPPPAPPAPRLAPPTKAPPTPAGPSIEAPVQSPAPPPPKRRRSPSKNTAPAPAPGPVSASISPESASSIAPSPFSETSAASVLRSTALMIIATLLVSCAGVFLF